MKKLVLIMLVMVSLSFVIAAEENINNNSNNNVINVNINTDDLKDKSMTKAGFGVGITTPMFGTYHDVISGGVTYTKSMTGINMLMGFTRRNYLGEGLPSKGGAMFFEFGTMILFIPFAGLGYDYKVSENFLIGTGLPDVVHFSVKF